MEGKGEMTKAPISLQDLRRSLYVKAKAEPPWRFWGLYVHVCKVETLREAYRMARSNGGAPGIDGGTFEAIEEGGAESFLGQSRMVDLKKGESFTFLGFEYRRILSLRRKWRPYYAPKLKKRTALFEKLREIFRQHVSWPVEIVIAKINPILRGWVNYFRVGHSSSCFSMVKRWVEKKVRQHLMRARGRKGFGWKRWSSE